MKGICQAALSDFEKNAISWHTHLTYPALKLVDTNYLPKTSILVGPYFKVVRESAQILTNVFRYHFYYTNLPGYLYE